MNYLLAEANQNTFVMFDCLADNSLPIDFFKMALNILKNEDRDDALILIPLERKNDALVVKMVVLGLDGALGEFCGNGARACAAYLFENYPLFKRFFIKTQWGLHPLLRLQPDDYLIELPLPRLELNTKFIRQVPKGFSYVEMIEPHLIIEATMCDEELFKLGRMLNQQRGVFPLGINVNAWQSLDDDQIYVKTYERGVQRLTQSCGTGSMSCAAFYRKKGGVNVLTPGGLLRVSLKKHNIALSGPACVSCTKKIVKWD